MPSNATPAAGLLTKIVVRSVLRWESVLLVGHPGGLEHPKQENYQKNLTYVLGTSRPVGGMFRVSWDFSGGIPQPAVFVLSLKQYYTVVVSPPCSIPSLLSIGSV